MKHASPALIALLNSNTQLAWFDLFTFQMVANGVTTTLARYSGADRALVVPRTVGSDTFALGPLVKRERVKTSVGISVDTMDITVNCDDSVTINSVPLLAFIAAGGLDGARVLVERAFMASAGSAIVGTLEVFSGRASDLTVNRNEAKIVVQSDLELLNTRIPRNLAQAGCVNSLYDSACTLSRSGLTVSNAVTVSPVPTRTVFDTTLGQATGYFDLGVVTFATGANAGVPRTVKAFTAGGLVELIAPLPFAPASGDTFSIYPGCNKTMARCTALSNIIHFRGMPFVPVPETAI